MRFYISILILSCTAFAAQATVVDFEELPITDVNVDCGGVDGCTQSFTSQGFVFTGLDEGNSGPMYSGLAIRDFGPTGNSIWAGAAYDALNSLVITHESGQAFAVQSLDVLLYSNHRDWDAGTFTSTSPIEIAGYDQFGAQVAFLSLNPVEIDGYSSEDWTNVLFDSAWSSVYSVTVSDQQISSNWGLTTRHTSLDNFTASVVPIPAAVWLFGSALAGLGWLRRKPVG